MRKATVSMLLAACAVGQVLPGTSPQQPVTAPRTMESPWGQTSFGDQPLEPVTGDQDLDGVTSRWTVTGASRPEFLGFPSFPAGLGQYAPRPRTLTELISNSPIGSPLTGWSQIPFVPTEEMSGWPAWVRLKGRAPLPYQPDLALLVQGVERVWWQDVGEDAFIPLQPYDKLRGVAAGVEVEVRQTGEFELLFHGGARLRAQGPTRLRIDRMDEEVVAITVDALTHLTLEPAGRKHTVTLPDGSVLEVAALPPPPLPTPAAVLPGLPIPAPGGAASLFPGLAPIPSATPPATGATGPAKGLGVAEDEDAPLPLRSLLVIQRGDEPGWRSGRATIWNAGGTAVEWRHAFGSQPLAERERVTLFLAPQPTPIAAALQAGETVVVGNTVRCRPGDDGEVSWSGARFRLPANATVRFDPVQGNPFARPLPENR